MSIEIDLQKIEGAISLVGGNAKTISHQHKIEQLLRLLAPNGLTLVPKFTAEVLPDLFEHGVPHVK